MSSLSVALCTYNGERFIAEQLQSIASQTRRPDELLVCDDASTDNTLAIVRTFARAAPFRVRVLENATNIGTRQNFERAISSCGGEFIALSDQDDVWRQDKLEVLSGVLESSPETGLVFSDAVVVDESLRPMGFTLAESVHFTPRERKLIQGSQFTRVLLRRNVVMGATSLFRAKYRAAILPIPEVWLHDSWTALIIGALSRIKFVDAPMVSYRQHAENQIGASRRRLFRQVVEASSDRADIYRREARRFAVALDRLRGLDLPVSPRALMDLTDRVEHLRMRAALPARRLARQRPILHEVRRGGYRRWTSWRAVIEDALLRSG